VTPGTTISLRMEIVDKYRSERVPARGHLDQFLEGVDEAGDVVISWTALVMIERRRGGPEA